MSGPSIGVFVSPHGFGHAARASALMEALARRIDARYELFATTARWFFDETVEGLYRLHDFVTDVGFVQRSALEFDGPATAGAVNALVPFDDALVDGLATELRRAGVKAVLCDIAPLGIAAAKRAGVPSILVENFLWPWLYEPLFPEVPELEAPARELSRWFDRATVHVQTAPICDPDPAADLSVGPMARPSRRTRAEVRRALGLGPEARVVVVTMGGVPQALPFIDRLAAVEGVTFLVTGAPATGRVGDVHLFDNLTRIYMPDFLRAADAVVGKLGYSTVAEVWREGLPFAYVTRSDFRETPPLARWVASNLSGFEVPSVDFAGGDWIDRVGELVDTPRTPSRGDEAVADGVADFIAVEVLGLV